MERNNHLLSLAEKVEQIYQTWRKHPDDIAYQRQYEKAKTQLDNEVMKYKKIAALKHPH